MRYCCPKCGNIDRSMWMQNRWRTQVYFIHREYPEDIPPYVLDAYESKKSFTQDPESVLGGGYGYRLDQMRGIIERILIEEVEAFGYKSAFHQPSERMDHSINIHMKKLTEFNGD